MAADLALVEAFLDAQGRGDLRLILRRALQKIEGAAEKDAARADRAEDTVRTVATMLGWVNVPPRALLEATLRSLRARLENAERDAWRTPPDGCDGEGERWSAAFAEADQERIEAQAEVARVKSLIDRDRTGLAASLDAVRRVANGYFWIAAGEWGSYDYTERTEGTLRAEIGRCLGEILELVQSGLRQSGDRALAAFRPETQADRGGLAAAVLREVETFNPDLRHRIAAALREGDVERDQLRGELARAKYIPGVMRCAKCAFRLVRTILYMGSGTAGPGGNETEPCPNGCGPLWPVTWEEDAREGWREAERLANVRALLDPKPAAYTYDGLVAELLRVLDAPAEAGT